MATDELCCTLKEKTLGNRIDDTTGGNAGVEPRLAVMYTEMVERRGYSLPQYVDLVSSNAAKVMGLYPRKGALAAGSDADITILDPTHEDDSSAFTSAHRLDSLEGATVAIISNGKKGTKPFFDAFERELREAHGVAEVVRRTKANYSAPVERELLGEAEKWQALVAGIGD